MRHHNTMVGKSKTKDGPIEFDPKYQVQMAKEKAVQSLAISQSTTISEYVVLKEAQKRVKIGSALTKVFGKEESMRILALATYSVFTGKPLSYAQSWLVDYGFGDLDLEATRISELLPRVHKDLQNAFFKD